MDERVCLLEMPVCIWLVPHAVEPDPADRAVIGEQLAQLPVHVIVEVSIPVAAIGTAVVPWSAVNGGFSARIVVRVVPVKLRVIEEQFYALAMTFVGQHLQRISGVGSALDDVPI